MKKIKTILLDIDDTFLTMQDGQYLPHPRYGELFQYDITFWSASEYGPAIAKLLGCEFISKDSEIEPSADVLIDDTAAFANLCSVLTYYKSIDAFLEKYGSVNGV